MRELITFVTDRPGHDRRYAIDAAKLETRTRLAAAGDLRHRHREDRATGISTTDWWWRPLRENVYAGERLGVVEER